MRDKDLFVLLHIWYHGAADHLGTQVTCASAVIVVAWCQNITVSAPEGLIWMKMYSSATSTQIKDSFHWLHSYLRFDKLYPIFALSSSSSILHHHHPVASQAPVPLSIFRSNSKFDENSERSSFKYIRPITTIFCTRHDSDTVVTCAKCRCDWRRIFYTRVFWIFIEFQIRSKYA